ncbi:Sulfur carrier protein CysO [subsurface metagenome]
MSVRVEFLGPLKQVVGGEDIIELEADTIAGVIEKLNEQYQGVTDRLLEPEGTLHRHINIYLNEEDIRFKEQLQTALSPGDVLTVISAIAGG